MLRRLLCQGKSKYSTSQSGGGGGGLEPSEPPAEYAPAMFTVAKGQFTQVQVSDKHA